MKVQPSVRIDPGINTIIQAAKLYAVIGQARFAQRPRSGCQAGGGEFPIIETVPRPVLSDRRDFDLSFLFRCLLANSEQKPAAPSSQHRRSEEHTSELQSLMRKSYAVLLLTKKNKQRKTS